MKRKMKLRKRYIIKLQDKIYATFILVFLITFILFRKVNKEVEVLLKPLLDSDIKAYSMNLINNAIIDSDKTLYDNIIYTEKNSDNEIIGVDFDNYKVNSVLSNLNKYILDKLNNNSLNNNLYDNNDGIYSIPFYIFSNNILLKNLGFKMNFKVKTIGNLESNIKTEVLSYGINNSLIKMYISVKVNMLAVLPFTTSNISVNTDVLVLTKIINGSIPEVYGGMYSVSTSNV